jgi:two-component system sensor histidine kinase DegS
LAEITEVAVMVAGGLLVGFLIDRVRIAQQRAKMYAAHALRIQEDELKRISRDLHDNVIQTLAAFCRQLDSIKYFSRGLPSSAIDDISAVRNSMETMIGDLRNLTKSLRPFILDELGLVESMRRLVADSAKRAGFEGRVDVVGSERRVGAEQETYLFRIAQEAVRNVEQHASATHVTVEISFLKEQMALRIADDGVGFESPSDPGGLGRAGKFGIIGMLEHAELLGGRLTVESRAGAGTKVVVVVPMHSESNTGNPESHLRSP